MKQHHILIGGKKISFVRTGNTNEKAIVFLHGNSLNKEIFKNQIESITSVPVICLDLPGHGDSEAPAEPERAYTFKGYSEMLVEVIEKLEVKNYIIGGHSLGGHIAVNALPGLSGVRGLAIFGTPPVASIHSLGEAFLPNPNFPYLLQGPLTDAESHALAESMLHHKGHTNTIKRSILNTDPNARASFGASVGKGEVTDEISILNAHKIPVALLHGEHDTFINKEYLERIKLASLFGNKVHVIKNSGHCPSMETPDDLNRLLLSLHASVFN